MGTLNPPVRDSPAPIALGCMNFGKRTDRATAARIVDAALDAGIDLLDTANVYNDGESERIVGALLKGRRHAIRVATKVGLCRLANRNEGLSAPRILAACDESLVRLHIDAIDIYYLHAPDPETPLAASVEAVGSLLACGKIKAWGVSNFASWQILELCGMADSSGIARPVIAQQMYNVLVRQLEIEYFAYAARHPLHTTIYNPLAGGLLAGAHLPDTNPPLGGRFDRNPMYQRRYWQPPLFTAVDALRGVGDRHGMTLLNLAYAFVFRNPGVDSVLVGPASEAHLAAAIAARSIPLPPAARKDIDAVGLSLTGTDAKYAR